MSLSKSAMSCQQINERISLLVDSAVSEFVGYTGQKSGNNHIGTFICSCGNVFEAQIWNVLNSGTKSCGCLKHGPTVRRIESMDHVDHALYETWKGMKSRCFSKSSQSYKYYGARGITVCERWKKCFASFVEDMGRKPSENHSIDRINNDGNYEPGNCRWATAKEQRANQRPKLSR